MIWKQNRTPDETSDPIRLANGEYGWITTKRQLHQITFTIRMRPLNVEPFQFQLEPYELCAMYHITVCRMRFILNERTKKKKTKKIVQSLMASHYRPIDLFSFACHFCFHLSLKCSIVWFCSGCSFQFQMFRNTADIDDDIEKKKWKEWKNAR